VVVSDAPEGGADTAGMALLAEFGSGIPVVVAGPDGTVRRSVST